MKSFTLCKIWSFIFFSSQHRSLTSLLRILQIDDMDAGKLVRHRVPCQGNENLKISENWRTYDKMKSTKTPGKENWYSH